MWYLFCVPQGTVLERTIALCMYGLYEIFEVNSLILSRCMYSTVNIEISMDNFQNNTGRVIKIYSLLYIHYLVVYVHILYFDINVFTFRF